MLLLLYRVSRPHVAGLAKRDGAWLDVERHEDLDARPDQVWWSGWNRDCSSPTATMSGSGSRRCGHRQTRIVVLDAETSPFIDISAAEMLAQLAETLRRDGIELRIARDIGQFRDVMRSAVPEAFHHEVFRTIDEALDAPAGADLAAMGLRHLPRRRSPARRPAAAARCSTPSSP